MGHSAGLHECTRGLRVAEQQGREFSLSLTEALTTGVCCAGEAAALGIIHRVPALPGGRRLGRVAFHPMGRHLGTASFDLTWRLWDVETGQCLLEQEGHSRSVYTVAFQVRAGSVK